MSLSSLTASMPISCYTDIANRPAFVTLLFPGEGRCPALHSRVHRPIPISASRSWTPAYAGELAWPSPRRRGETDPRHLADRPARQPAFDQLVAHQREDAV